MLCYWAAALKNRIHDLGVYYLTKIDYTLSMKNEVVF